MIFLLYWLTSGFFSCLVLNWFREHRPDVDSLLKEGQYSEADLYLLCLMTGPLVGFWAICNKYR